MLEKHCENTQLYLRHDLTLQQLSTAIGTNRTYLSAYFAQRNITYNTYINSLRIEHFIRIYRENKDSLQSITALQLAHESGFYNYNTFSSAFKRYVGFTVAEWMKSEDATKPST
ncbi:MAG: helix-turn-helix transcriptional regulator [Bacteroidaceae bacterium]|nr:helix-turn-helix transcriptional regulator [Bacteroidaceae bacterium]